jgi:two-component system, cell cycle response regulator DivK
MAKILLVEDNDMNRDMIARYLKYQGFMVVTAVDGAAGVAAAMAEAPDLILMDLSLPVLDGWEATRRIKSDSQTGHIPIVALSALATAGARQRCFAAGCNDYEPKPINFARLLAKITALLDKEATA